MTTRIEQIRALLPAIEAQLGGLAATLTELHELLRQEKQARSRAGGGEHFANALDAERLANAVTGRLRDLGLAWLLDLASTTSHRGPEWVRALDATLEGLS